MLSKVSLMTQSAVHISTYNKAATVVHHLDGTSQCVNLNEEVNLPKIFFKKLCY